MSIWRPDLSGFPGPRYVALAEAISQAISNGSLKPGARLPPRRDLAHELGISVNTVGAAYIEAERRGYVTGEVGRGTFVRAAPQRGDGRFFLGKRPSDLIDLSICRPCTAPFQRDLLRDIHARLARQEDHSAMLACRPIAGFESHRLAAVDWLRFLGLECSADRVLLTNGCAHGLLVVLLTILEPGSVVACEMLTDHGLISLSQLLRFPLYGLRTDEQGIVPDDFEAACRDQQVRVLATTPTLTNPTCALMSDDRRRQIAEIARAHDVLIVEDDVFGALVSDRPTPLSMYLPENSFYLTSFTKVALSGLRTGLLAAPSATTHRLAARIRSTSWMATPLVAEIATHWINDRTMHALVDWQRGEIKDRQRMVRGLLDGFTFHHHREGNNVWIPLPDYWRAANFTDQARLHGVSVTGAEPFVVGRLPEPHAVRISVGSAQSRDELAAGLRILRHQLSHPGEPVYLNV